jgi:tetratricopeptide (TPR) repeat protein
MGLVGRLVPVILLIPISCTSGLAQSAPPAGQPTPPGLPKLTGDDEKRAKELDTAVEAALKADRWDEAIAKAEELVALRTKAQGPKHFETANAEWHLRALRRVAPMSHEDRLAYESARTINEQAETLIKRGKYAEAQPLFEKALEIRRRLLTDDHPSTAESYINLGYNLYLRGRYKEAQPLYEKALEILRRLLTDDHPLTAESYNNLAMNLGRQAKYAQAQPLLEKSLEIRRRLLTDDDPLTATGYNNLGSILYAQAKYAQAQPLFERALRIRRRLFTDDHPSTAESYNNVAVIQYAQGQYAAAQPLYEKALEIRRRLLTDDHPSTAEGYNNLAANLAIQGKFAEAQPLYEKALELFHRLLTDDHPLTANVYANLATNLAHQGQYAAAQPLSEKALALYRRRLTDDHPQTASSYNSVAANLTNQGQYVAAQPLLEKALEIRRHRLGEDHPETARSYAHLAANLAAQGKYAQAESLDEKALAIRRLSLTDDHPETAMSYDSLAADLADQGKYREALDRWQTAVRSLDRARPRIAFAGLDRAGRVRSMRPDLAALLARLGRPAEAWQSLEEDLGRGLLDELAARKDQQLAPDERDRLRELTAALERLDKLAETTPKDLDRAERARRLDELKHQRELASIALGEFQTGLIRGHKALAGRVADLDEIRAALPADAALVAWIDIPRRGPNAADPDGEHWGVVVRSRGVPAWIPIAGTGPNGRWSEEDTRLSDRVRIGLRTPSAMGPSELRTLVARLRTQRLEPMAKALGDPAADQPPVRSLIVLPSRAVAGIPVETLLAPDDTRMVSYAPSATVYKYLRAQPRPDRHAGVLALGDPVFERPDESSEPKPLPDHGLLVKVVAPGSNAATHGIKPGDVLLKYRGRPLNRKDDLKVAAAGDKPIGVEIWRDGRSSQHDVAPGDLGMEFDPRPATAAIAEQHKMQQVLRTARTGREHFAALPGTRLEVEAVARLFHADGRLARLLLASDATEPELDRLAAAGELGRFAFIHLATHGVIDEDMPTRSAVILTQTGLPDPLAQALAHKPVFDGRLSVREIQRTWELKAEVVTLSACQTALGRAAGGEGFVGFTQALLMSGARSVVLSLWKVDDRATALLMVRFYQNLLGRRSGLSGPLPKAEALREAKVWLRNLTADEVGSELAAQDRGEPRKLAKDSGGAAQGASPSANSGEVRPYAHPYYWAAFVLVGNPD